jgi:DNA polymerase-3 subunit alpha
VSLFNESYLKHEHLMREGEVLLVKGKFQPRWGNESEFEFRVSSIQQMASVGTGLTESITVKIPVERLTNAFIDDIEKLCQAHQGKHKLKMSLETEGLVLPLISKALSVQVSNGLIQEIEKLGLSYKLN